MLHQLRNEPVWPFFTLQQVSRYFKTSIQDSPHLRRMMRLSSVSLHEPACAPLLVVHRVLGDKKEPITSCPARLQLMDLECTSPGWGPWDHRLTRTLSLKSSVSPEGSWRGIRLCSTARTVKIGVIVDGGLWTDVQDCEEWHFDSNATLGDFYARWLLVGSRSVAEHETARALESTKEWRPR